MFFSSSSSSSSSSSIARHSVSSIRNFNSVTSHPRVQTSNSVIPIHVLQAFFRNNNDPKSSGSSNDSSVEPFVQPGRLGNNVETELPDVLNDESAHDIIPSDSGDEIEDGSISFGSNDEFNYEASTTINEAKLLKNSNPLFQIIASGKYEWANMFFENKGFREVDIETTLSRGFTFKSDSKGVDQKLFLDELFKVCCRFDPQDAREVLRHAILSSEVIEWPFLVGRIIFLNKVRPAEDSAKMKKEVIDLLLSDLKTEAE